MKWARKLSVVEKRGVPLTAGSIRVGEWVRVKADAERVQKLCKGDGEDQVCAPAPRLGPRRGLPFAKTSPDRHVTSQKEKPRNLR
jgi:hypothetical protein